MKELIEIQTTLIAKKNQYNDFGKYSYRNTEDILESVKPLLRKHECFITLTDDISMVGDRIYISATATITNKDGHYISSKAFAREALIKKGMDESQITGSASSYARKYALNGLLAIDDSKDQDTLNQRKAESVEYKTSSKATEEEKKIYWGEFRDACQVYEVDPMEFLESQIDITDKNKMHNTVVHWLRHSELLNDQLLVYKQS